MAAGRVVTDLEMQDEDGFSLLRRARRAAISWPATFPPWR
jgi:DNA-binding response OmpR family regulator